MQGVTVMRIRTSNHSGVLDAVIPVVDEDAAFQRVFVGAAVAYYPAARLAAVVLNAVVRVAVQAPGPVAFVTAHHALRHGMPYKGETS